MASELTGVCGVERFSLRFVDVGVVTAAAARRHVASSPVERSRLAAV